ncbi:hypothetical protein D3C75_1048550 [compost metagenome]
MRLSLAEPGLGPRHFETSDRVQRGQLLVMSQLFAGTPAGGLCGIELGLEGGAVETRQGVALLEGFAFTEWQFDNSAGQLTGQYCLIAGPQYTTGLTAGRGGSDGRRVIQQRIIRFGRLRLSHARHNSQSEDPTTQTSHSRNSLTDERSLRQPRQASSN